MRGCQELPGQQLFHYRSVDDEMEAIGSDDVNDYIHRHAGSRYTAKDFRTWMGSLHALIALDDLGPGEDESERKSLMVEAVDRVAENLRNTRAVCRSSYIHPGLLELYDAGRLIEVADLGSSRASTWLDAEEVALARVLRHLDDRDSDTR